jgi:HEAT repeat protein
MKKLSFIFVFLVAVVFITAETFAKGPVPPLSKSIQESAVNNLLVGLESDNFGLKTSSAYLLGELESAKAVIPLLKILHNDANEEARIMAALALYKIGDARGLYAIKQAIRFDDSERVRNLCTKFYKAYLSKEIEDSFIVALK